MRTRSRGRTHNQPVRILYLIDRMVSDRAGTEGQLVKLISGLPRDRFTPYLGCFVWTPWMESSELGIPRYCIGSNQIGRLRFPYHLLRFAAYLCKQEIEIVQCQFPTSITAGVLAAKLAGVRHIVSCRRDMGFWYGTAYRGFVRFCNFFVDQIVSNSIAVSRLVQAEEGVDERKTRVIYNGIQGQGTLSEEDRARVRKEMGFLADDLVVGIVANMNRHVKRVDLFLQAAATVLEKMEGVRFVVIGTGGLMGEMKELSRSLRLEGSIQFMGSVEDAMRFIQGFDVAVSSSDSEGFSNAVLEYMACGIPVVATDSGGNREILRDRWNGILVRSRDSCALAGAILQLLSDEEQRGRMGSRAREAAMNFSVERMIGNYVDLYNSLLG